MKIEFFHIIDEHNAGDQVCCPALYFEEFRGCSIKHIRAWTPDPERASIFGGGGMLYHELHDILNAAAVARKECRTGPIIIWGAGENMHNQGALLEPSYLKHFDLVGLRDWGHSLAHYVPCPSCMVDLFFTAPNPTLPVVIYEHFDSPINCPFFPKLSNRSSVCSMAERISFLAQGEIIVTNTYHGVYWAQLIGRKVLIVSPPVSSRLQHFQYQPPIVLMDRLVSSLSKAVAADKSFLSQCLDQTHAFMSLYVSKLLA